MVMFKYVFISVLKEYVLLIICDFYGIFKIVFWKFLGIDFCFCDYVILYINYDILRN